jgi:photosystem II PsbY protein
MTASLTALSKPCCLRAGQQTTCSLIPVRSSRRVTRVQASLNGQQQAQIAQAAAAGTAISTFLAAGNAHAAQEVAQLAAGDNRFGIITLLLAPVAGWVLFNIAGPALNQLNNMQKRSIVGGLGLTAATLLAAQNADAAQEVAQLAAGDNRFSIIALLLVPVVGWVLFNISGPALNQLRNMTGGQTTPKGGRGKRSVVAGMGLTAASMLLTQNADAAEAALRDNRLSSVALLLAPAVGWVLFNISGPALNQFNNMKRS